MKICGISDIHGNLLENIPECNVLCICGDIVTLNAQRNIEQSAHWWDNKFIPWVMKLPCKKVIVVPGNHDFYLEDKYKKNEWKAFKSCMSILSENKVEFLIDEEYTYEGIKFYGTPWIEPIKFQENRWAFSNNKCYKKIPICDVLITHDNPEKNKYLDNDSIFKSKYHLYGHWHDGDDNVQLGRYNCSRLDDWYNFKKNYKFVILDIMTETEKKQVEQEFLNKLISKAYNNNVADWLKTFKEIELQQDIEDSIPWDTSAEILESAIVNDTEE